MLVLGIVGLTVCQVCGPIAWVMGRRTLREIDASGGQYGGRGLAQAGFITGIIASLLLAIGLITLVLVLVAAVLGTR